MTELARLSFGSDLARSQSGAKLRRAAISVGLSEIEATRLVTAILEVAARAASGPLEVVVSLGDSKRPALELSVEGAITEASVDLAHRFVKHVGRTPEGLRITWPLRAVPTVEIEARAIGCLTAQTREARVLEEQQARLQEAKEEADRANRAKSDFLSSMSHELRTPMNSILGFTRRLIKRLDGEISGRDLDALYTVDRNAKHLLALINDVLDLSKIEAGKMELSIERVSLGVLVREVLSQSASLLEDNVHELDVVLPEAPVELTGDARKLRQILTNLVSNAIKYGGGGVIRLRLEQGHDPQLGAVGTISVRDHGQGMSSEQMERLFHRFTRLATAATSKAGGTGLGLAISAEYAAMHGGRIDVWSELGQGSRFTLVLPLRPAAQGVTRTAMPRPADVPPAVRRAATVLCVDDDPDLLEFLRLTFADADLDVRTATGVENALAQAREATPDLLCLDVHLQDGTGYEIMEALRQDPATANVPAVFISGDDEAAAAIALESKRFMRKPVDPADLIETARSLLREPIEDVLVVEDDRDTRKLLIDSFSDLGVKVAVASNGREAISRLKERVPSVVVLDLMMPVMDGFELLRELRATPQWQDIPVVVLTGMELGVAQLTKLEALGAAILRKDDDVAHSIDSILAAKLSGGDRAS